MDLFEAPELATNALRFEARPRIMPILKTIFGALTKQDLMAACDRIGLPFAPITKPHELFDDPHLQGSGGLLDVTLGDGRVTKIPALPLSMSGRRTEIRHDLPRIGQHSREILAAAGFSPEEIAEMIEARIVVTDA